MSNNYPQNAIPFSQITTGTTGAVTNTVAGVTGRSIYICGVAMSSTQSATATASVVFSLSGGTSSLTFYTTRPASTGTSFVQNFASPYFAPPATNIVFAVGADANASAVNLNVWGYYL